MSYDAFEEEQQILDAGDALLERSDLTTEALRQAFLVHHAAYRKLIKTTRRLVKVNDRNEESLKDANLQVRKQQTELQEAHAELGRHAEVLEAKVRDRTKALVYSQDKLQKLVELGIALSAEQDLNVLLKRILWSGKEISQADAATLYLRTEDNHLRFALRSKTDEMPSFTIPLYDPVTGQPNLNYVSTCVALSGESVRIDDVYQETRFDLSGTRKVDAETGYRTVSMLTVSLKSRKGECIGVLQLINSLDQETGAVQPFDANLTGFVEALGAQAAIALDNLYLIKAQAELFDSVIKIIAAAIDAKSPYTGGHCERVPELGRMLAEAACQETTGPFAEFSMDTDAWREFHLAGWLHDCGKVTTPEYVVDKATKLETIYNRIHEIRTRFEVLRRDRIIDFQERLLAGGQRDLLQAELDQQLQQLNEDFAFVAESNVGGEFMSPSRLARLEQIAAIEWTRYFDDRLGISEGELERLRDVPKTPLPNREKLLADKPDMIVPRKTHPLSYDPAHWGFKVTVPEALYNYGELYNLRIARGTLTEEERFKIVEHVINTIVMLDKLPFPKNMQRVSAFAGAHHETMIGTGYPRRLKRDDMPVQARILAIADIFEALTASDRPYKKAKTVNEALRIMKFMCKDQHIDPDLFELFVKSQVWKSYADIYLHPHQIDKVDLAAYLTLPEK
ncbi:MAG: GAF domain-containing protein [Magnetococcus sp. DMHC-1]